MRIQDRIALITVMLSTAVALLGCRSTRQWSVSECGTCLSPTPAERPLSTYANANQSRSGPPKTASSTDEATTRFVQFVDEELDHELLPEPQAEQVPLTADKGEWNLADLEEMALANNPSLAQSQARVEAARGNWVQVGLKPNPVIGYLANEIGNEGRAGQQGAFISQQFITAGKLDLNRQVAGQEISRAEQQFAAQRFRVLNDVRSAYYRSLLAQKRVNIAQQLTQVSDEVVRRAEALLKNKEGSRVHALQARTEADTVKLVLANAENQRLVAWRQLATVVGMSDLPPKTLTGDPEKGLPERTWESSLDRLLLESPEMSVALTNVERAKWVLNRACAGRYPNVTGQLAVQHDDATGDVVTSVQVGVPLQIFNRNQGNIYKAQSELRAAENVVQRVELDLENRLAAVFGQYAIGRRQLQNYSRDILPNAKKTLDLVQVGYREGELDYLTVLTAQRTYFQASLSYLDALRAAWEATIGIEGFLLTGSLRDQK